MHNQKNLKKWHRIVILKIYDYIFFLYFVTTSFSWESMLLRKEQQTN